MNLVRKGRIDPIEILREYITQRKPIRYKRDKQNKIDLQFDNITLRATMETAWKSTKSGRDYNLGSLWWYLDTCQKKIESKEYRSKAFEMGIDFVSLIDQQEIEDYFTGKIDYTECINADKKSQLFKKQNQEELKTDLMEPALSKRVKPEGESKGPVSLQEFHLRVIEEIVRFEKPITSKNRLFRCQDRTFEQILEVSKKILYGQQRDERSSETPTNNFNGSLLQEILTQKLKPLIIVPQIFELGNLSLKNAKKFFEDGEYVDPSNIKFTNDSRSVDVTHHFSSIQKDVVFEVRDTPSTIDQKSWKRVVAVFLRGSAYELKSFPNSQDVTLFFKRYRGYHMKFEEEAKKDQIKLWNVKILELHRLKRHYDTQVKAQFWEDLESFVLRPPFVETKK